MTTQLLLPSRRSSLLRVVYLLFFVASADGIANIGVHGDNNELRFPDHPFQSNQQFQKHNGDDSPNQRKLNHRRKSTYYEFLESKKSTSPTTLFDVWLCLACALGWSIWMFSTQRPAQEVIFEQQDSKMAVGHVQAVSLGEDILGTGIPVYYALIDYVVEGETDQEHIQVRKVFASKKLLEEGFANVEVLYLLDDPTIAILMDDFVAQTKERDNQSNQSPTNNVVPKAMYFVSVLVIVIILLAGILLAGRMERPLYGYISLGIGLLLLYPSAKWLYKLITHLYSLAGPLTERPGEIIHGKRLYWKHQCHGTLNPMEILGVGEKRNSSIELSDLQVPGLGDTTIDSHRVRDTAKPSATPKLFPNAGCGFGNFNVHLPNPLHPPTGSNSANPTHDLRRPRTNSSVSSMSASASHSDSDGVLRILPNHNFQRSASQTSKGSQKMIRRKGETASILEKYEEHQRQQQRQQQQSDC